MNYLIARIAKDRKNPIRVLISECSVFKNVKADVSNYPEYDPDHNLDEDSWFKVLNFSKQDYFLDFLSLDFDAKEYQSISKSEVEHICFLCSIQNGDFYFQKVTPSLFLKKKILCFGEVVELDGDGGKIIINENPDAIYIKNEDCLIFKNISTVSSIFPGIDELYKEATHDQVVDFLNNSFIDLVNDFCVDKVSKPNRKRIALAIETLVKLSEEEQKEVIKYIHFYCEEKLSFNSEKSCCYISSDEELKNLIYGIEQRFYTTPFSKEKRLANSVQKIT